MNIEGARRVMETTCHDTANQYLRFGWRLINQYVVEATQERPSMVTYVLASIHRIEDTREVLVLVNPDEVNEHLALGWKMIDKHVTTAESSEMRHETMHFVLAWQSDDPPARPGSTAVMAKDFEISLDVPDET